VSPVQFHEMWSATNERSAEFKLALAVLEQALEDIERYQSASDGPCRRLYRNARGWLLSGDRKWAYSFANVCELLDVPAQRIRARVLDLSAEREAEEALFQDDSGEVYAIADEA
jgi:hypothetical protein